MYNGFKDFVYLLLKYLSFAKNKFLWMLTKYLFWKPIYIAGCQLDFVKKKVFLKGLIFKKKGFCNKKKGFPCQMDSFLIPAKGFFYFMHT